MLVVLRFRPLGNSSSGSRWNQGVAAVFFGLRRWCWSGAPCSLEKWWRNMTWWLHLVPRLRQRLMVISRHGQRWRRLRVTRASSLGLETMGFWGGKVRNWSCGLIAIYLGPRRTEAIGGSSCQGHQWSLAELELRREEDDDRWVLPVDQREREREFHKS